MPDDHAPIQQKRLRKTAPHVLFADKAAKAIITVGGIGTIVAVLTVGLYLVWVVLPLFMPPRVDPGQKVVEQPMLSGEPRYVQMGIDEYENLGWILLPDGAFEITRLDTGETIERVDPDGDATLSAFAIHAQFSQVAIGYPDGTVRLGTIGFESTFVDLDDAPESVRGIEVGSVASVGPQLFQRVSADQFRAERFNLNLNDPAAISPGNAVTLIDVSVRPTGPILAAVTADGTLHIKAITERRNMLTGKTSVSFMGGQVPVEGFASAGMPKSLLLTGVADNAFLVWPDGALVRYATLDPVNPSPVQRIDVIPDEGVELATVGFLLGKTSVVVGDSSGALGVWFRVASEEFDGADLVRAHFFPGRGSPVTAMSPSLRTRSIAAGFADGSLAMYQVTASREIGRAQGPTSDPVRAVRISPKEGTVFGLTENALAKWQVNANHPEITLSSLFGRVWYEGYSGPQHVWQSSSGTDDFEPKYGLIPLIFGTLKATFYSLLFGAPLALLAAIYTSEFLNPKTRQRIKPLIELMASLPSVVLGFLAALIFAPIVEDVVPQTLALFVTFPVTLLAGAHLVQMLPEGLSRVADRLRLPLMLLSLPIAIGLAMLLGPVFEALFFSGDIKAWLDGQVGTGAGGWLLLLIPLCGVGVAFLSTRLVRPVLREKGAAWPRQKVATASLLVFLGAVAATFAIAIAISQGLAAVDIDPRGSFVDTYVQRNALVVGFVMGFAIIPIIYTLAEDALSSVPEHLRSASLGAGATPWQTAVRVVIPVAMSGLFSALMIGFGRAVGETMIVLMAAGNTPVMEWNIFNGFRTLSANIAVELPEAVRGSSHYRVLFLAALSLFVMTFIVNTFAELVRQRFRKRAFQL
jgi:phosphate transport system permease protein